MADTVELAGKIGAFAECLRTLSWCKQEGGVLVAVSKFTPELIDILTDCETRVYPGGMRVKTLKSWLAELKEKFEDGLPVPVLLVWRQAGVEMWYRRTHKIYDFPYDTWSDPAAAAYEKEQALFPVSESNPAMQQHYKELVDKAAACPAQIPNL